MTPRGMSKETAAQYAGCESLSSFDDWVRRGIMPPKIPGTNKWDRKAIDAALDRLSGFQPTIAPKASAFDLWKAQQDDHQDHRDTHHPQAARER